MKKYFLITLLLLLTGTLFAQEGINFDQSTWKEVLAKAKQEKKLVFVDVYTGWCVPCKKMAAQVFTQKKVGNFFNSSFINYQIDAEKGEGITIAKGFGVRAYPTFLFVNGDGILVYRTEGYNEAGKFLQEAAIAIKEKGDPKPFAIWENEYNAGERSKAFLMGYLKKRSVINAPSADLIDLITPLLGKEEFYNPDFLASVIYPNSNIEYVPNGRFYNYVIAHYKEIDPLLGKNNGYSLHVLDMGMRNYFNKNIIKDKKEDMLPVIIAAKKQLMALLNDNDADPELASKELTMNYYKGTKNVKKLIPAARDYVYNGLMKLNIAGKIAADKADFQKKMEPYLSGTEDSTKVPEWNLFKNVFSRRRMMNTSYNLRDAAEAIYKNVSDKNTLAEALEWAKKADSWYPHFSNKAVYAGLLFKTGHKSQAITLMQKASEAEPLKSSPIIYKLVMDNIDKLKRDEAPVDLWSVQI